MRQILHTVITDPGGEGIARVQDLLDALRNAHHLPPDPVTDLHIALDEVLSNTLRHGFADGRPCRVDVTLSVDGRALRVEIEDDGVPFDPLTAPDPDLEGNLHERNPGGLGLRFVRHLMNEVTYARVGGRNRLVLQRVLVNHGRDR